MQVLVDEHAYAAEQVAADECRARLHEVLQVGAPRPRAQVPPPSESGADDDDDDDEML